MTFYSRYPWAYVVLVCISCIYLNPFVHSKVSNWSWKCMGQERLDVLVFLWLIEESCSIHLSCSYGDFLVKMCKIVQHRIRHRILSHVRIHNRPLGHCRFCVSTFWFERNEKRERSTLWQASQLVLARRCSLVLFVLSIVEGWKFPE